MAKQLQELRGEFSAALAEAEALLTRLPHEAANRRPEAGKWSVVEVVQHLVQTGEAYLPAFRAVLGRGGPPSGVPRRYGAVARWWIRAVGPEGRAVPTLPRLQPGPQSAGASALDPAAVLLGFRRVTDGFLDVLDRAEGLDVGRVTMPSPLFGLLRLPVGAFLEANAGHGLRHLAQARRVAERVGA